MFVILKWVILGGALGYFTCDFFKTKKPTYLKDKVVVTEQGNINLKVCARCGYEMSFDAVTGIVEPDFCPSCGRPIDKNHL